MSPLCSNSFPPDAPGVFTRPSWRPLSAQPKGWSSAHGQTGATVSRLLLRGKSFKSMLSHKFSCDDGLEFTKCFCRTFRSGNLGKIPQKGQKLRMVMERAVWSPLLVRFTEWATLKVILGLFLFCHRTDCSIPAYLVNQFNNKKETLSNQLFD